MRTDEIDRLYVLSLFERRAANKVYQTFRVNRFELNLTMAMVCALGLVGRKSISKKELFDFVSGSIKAKAKMEGYWSGMVRTGMVKPVTLRNGQGSWVLTRLAVKCIETFEIELKRIETAEKARQARRQPNKEFLPIRVHSLSPEGVEDLGDRYRSIG